MSNASEKSAIASIASLSMGGAAITDLTATTKPNVNKISSIFEEVVKELLGDDWVFSRKRVNVEDLTQINKLTVDTAPSPAAFVIGKTLTFSHH